MVGNVRDLGFWGKLKKPFFVLAPMANVTDVAFRRMFMKYGKPDVMYAEFVSADGLSRADEKGKAILVRDLEFVEAERPIVAQFFTANPETMEYAASVALRLGFDGVDINMGCPDRVVEKQGAGAVLMKNPTLASDLVDAAKRGACSGSVNGIPVSIKTRLGFNKDELEEWLPILLEAKPAAVILHARTRKEMSKVSAHWDRVARAVEIRNILGSDALIVGNGDVVDLEDAYAKADATGVDGVMIGRGVFGKPWFFSGASEPLLETRLRIAVEHTELFEKLIGDVKSFAHMKKHFKAYCEGFRGARELRIKLMETKNAVEVHEIIEDFLQNVTPSLTV